MTNLAILILAAGTSSRMQGQDKLTLQAGDAPLLARVIRRAQDTGLATYVTVPDLTHPRAIIAKTLGARAVPVPDRLQGMSASLRSGIAALAPDTTAVMILPGDMPDLETEDFATLQAAAGTAPDKIIQATAEGGQTGHPVVFPAEFFDPLQDITKDQGGRQIIGAHSNRLLKIALPGTRATCDLDTPQDWEIWRAAQETRE